MPTHRFTLKVVKGARAPQTFVFAQDEIHIGSAYNQNDLVINTAGIASLHARIWREDRGYYLKNLCESGIMVGGNQSLVQDASIRLESGTDIDMGPVGLKFFEGEVPGADAKINSTRQKPAKGPLRILGFGAVGLSMVLVLFLLTARGKGKQNGSEIHHPPSAASPIELPAKGKYGYNETDKEHLDNVVFTFRTDATNVELFYTPGRTESGKELSIQLNGEPIGYVPKNEKDWGEETVVRLPTALLKRGEDNRLVFDNLKNPPQTDSWGVENIGIRDLPADLCDRAEAHRLFDLGDELYQQRTISKGNLLLAHQYYNNAIMRMQDCGEKGEFFRRTQLKKENVKLELDTLYNNLKFDYKKSFQMKRYANCRSILQDIMDYIPDEADKRHQEAAKKLEKYKQIFNRPGE